ncbi:MAG: DUF4861 family protein, partial [Prevotella sp.]|nr:DUF4861 family protein [Prevotella sp.]
MRRKLTLAMLAMMSMACLAQKTVSISVENKAKTDRMKAPVVIQLEKYGMNVRKAVVTLNGKEIPCQLDDINGDKRMDELCFLADMERKSKKVFSITLCEEGEQKEYTPEVYVEMLLTNRKVKSTNKQDLYISELKVDRGVNPYWMLHHHGAAFENSMVGYRIYFDHRQTIDIYGKYKEGLELRDTQFYPDEQQKAAGYGDDVLWVGQTFGLGALRGWNGKEPTMVSDVE